MKDSITLWNSNTLNSQEFKYVETIYSGSGEDKEIGGWKYISSDKKLKLIIFND